MITDEYLNCDLCVCECPNDAIHAGSEIYEIDAARCTECVGFHATEQCAAVCSVDWCVPDPDNVGDELALFARAQAIHPDRAEHLELTAETSRFRRD
jgi:ferredoxin